ncbi:MAG: c-type cytochrome [Candidatus Limnocylindria bacterium]
MRINILTTASVALAIAAIVSLGSVSARADVAAGKARFNAACGECHDSADFENENPQALAATLRRIVSGELKHKKPLQLSDQEIADIAAYMSTGGK